MNPVTPVSFDVRAFTETTALKMVASSQATCQAYLDAERLRINTQHHKYNPGPVLRRLSILDKISTTKFRRRRSAWFSSNSAGTL